MWGRGRDDSGSSGAFIWGGCGEDGWVKSSSVAPFSPGGFIQVDFLVGNLCRVELVRLGEDLLG